jgi:nucleoside-diphosphate-sugar epimerase
MRVGVTGSGGFFGKALVHALEQASIDAVPIRLPRSGQVLEPGFIQGLVSSLDVSAVVHMAAVRNPSNPYEFSVNAELPTLLENALRQARNDVRFIHLSSINTMLPNRQNSYSRSKRQAEAALDGTKATVIRPGIIWSWQPDAGGDAERLRTYLQRPLPFHPVPWPGQLYRPVLAESLANRMVDLLSEKDPPSVINAFGDTPLTIWDLANITARNTGARLLPVPTAFLETILPRSLLRHLPVALRSNDATTPDKSIWGLSEVTWKLPFIVPCESTESAL